MNIYFLPGNKHIVGSQLYTCNIRRNFGGTQRMKKDARLKPRKTGNLPPEKLRDILSRIYPEEMVGELMCGLGVVQDEALRTEGEKQ